MKLYEICNYLIIFSRLLKTMLVNSKISSCRVLRNFKISMYVYVVRIFKIFMNNCLNFNKFLQSYFKDTLLKSNIIIVLKINTRKICAIFTNFMKPCKIKIQILCKKVWNLKIKLMKNSLSNLFNINLNIYANFIFKRFDPFSSQSIFKHVKILENWKFWFFSSAFCKDVAKICISSSRKILISPDSTTSYEFVPFWNILHKFAWGGHEGKNASTNFVKSTSHKTGRNNVFVTFCSGNFRKTLRTYIIIYARNKNSAYVSYFTDQKLQRTTIFLRSTNCIPPYFMG